MVQQKERERILTVTEVSLILSMSEYSIREKLKTGEIQGFKVGNKWRVAQSTLNNIIYGEG